MENRPFYLAVDFDDTLRMCKSWARDEGVPNLKVIGIVQELHKRGWIIILWTCKPIDDLIKKWCRDHEIPIDYYNENPHAISWFEMNYGFSNWSEKVFADVYLDDSSFNPLTVFTKVIPFSDLTVTEVADALELFASKRHEEKTIKDSPKAGTSDPH